MADRNPTPTNATAAARAQMLAQAYRRGMMNASQAAAYEDAARRGAVDDPYAAARADEKSTFTGARRGAELSFTSALPFFNEAGAGLGASAGAIDNLFHGRPANFGDLWTRDRALQQGYQDQFQADHPFGTAGLKGAGLGAQVFGALLTGGASQAPELASAATAGPRSFLATTQRVAANVVRNGTRGGVSAAVNAAARPGTLQQRAQAATNAFAPGAALGVVTPVAVAALQRPLGAAVRAGDVIRRRMFPPPGGPAGVDVAPAEGVPAAPAPAPEPVPAALPLTTAAPEPETPEDAARSRLMALLNPSAAKSPAPVVPASAQPLQAEAAKAKLLAELTASKGKASSPELLSPAQSLGREGVSLTPGQWAMGLENRAATLPIIGQAFRDARQLSWNGLNQALANQALAPMGETLPPDVPVGQPTADYVRDRIAAMRDRSLGLIQSVEPDEAYTADVKRLMSKTQAEFPQPLIDHFGHAVDYAYNKINQAQASPEVMEDLFNWFDNNIDDHIDSPNETEDAYSQHLQNFKDTVAALAGRQNPGFMAAYAGAEQGRAVSDLLDRATAISGGDPRGFDSVDLLRAHAAVPPSHVTDLNAGAMQRALDLANQARAVMGGRLPTPPLLTPGANEAAPYDFLSSPYGLAPPPSEKPNAFEAAIPQWISSRIPYLNAFRIDPSAGLSAAGGILAAGGGNGAYR